MIDFKITCDYTGELLRDNGRNLRPYITLKGAVFYQGATTTTDDAGRTVPLYRGLTQQVPDRYGRLTSRTYAFRDATALADWVDQRAEDEGLEPLETYEDGK